MHNLILGAIKDHATHKLRLPEKSWKAVKTAEQNTSTSGTDYHDGDTSSSNEEGITASELRNLRRDASKGTPHPYKPGLIPTTPLHLQHSATRQIPTSIITSHLEEDDPDYAPPMDCDSSGSDLAPDEVSTHQLHTHHLHLLQDIINKVQIPSTWTRVPKNIGEAAHGNLKAAEWSLLYKVYIPLLFIHKDYTSSPIHPHMKNNTFHLISAVNIATSWTITQEQGTQFAQHWAKYRHSCQKLFPSQKSKPNHHLSEHIPEMFLRWGPAPSSAAWAYERMNGMFGKIKTNHHLGHTSHQGTLSSLNN